VSVQVRDIGGVDVGVVQGQLEAADHLPQVRAMLTEW